MCSWDATHYVHADRPERVHRTVERLSMTGRIKRPLITLQGTLLPTSRSGDVYAGMVDDAGRGALHRSYRITGGTHSAGPTKPFPGLVRPMSPCLRTASDALTAWTSAGQGAPRAPGPPLPPLRPRAARGRCPHPAATPSTPAPYNDPAPPLFLGARTSARSPRRACAERAPARSAGAHTRSMADTTTVEVDTDVHDRLAVLAADRGLSLRAYLAELTAAQENEAALSRAACAFEKALERPGFREGFARDFGSLASHE